MELLEREQPLHQLDEHLRLAAAGHGRLVLISGEAGVGKTSLVDAFCARAAAQATVLRTSYDSLSTPGPLGALRDLAVPLGLAIDQQLVDGGDRELLFRETLAAIAARPGTTVVIGEDAHWSDGVSIELLRFLGRRIDGLRTLFVVTYRDDEVGTEHPLRLFLGDLATAPAVHRIALLPLSEEATRQMAKTRGRDAATLHRLTGGNPFFLGEVLAAESESVPASVGDAILARAARLSTEARGVLDVAAVIGTAIDPELLLNVAGPVLDEVDECINRGLLRGETDRLVFRHELTREAILAAIAPLRRRLLHGRVLDALQEPPERSWDLARFAHHAEAAGKREAVLRFATAAAEHATTLHAHREAAAQYARVLRFADGVSAVERARLLERRATACYMNDQGQEAIAARREALDIWRSLGDQLKEGESLRWLSRLFWYDGHSREAEAAGIAALEVLERQAPGAELAMAYSNLAQLRMLDDDLGETLTWGNRAIALAEELGETETLVHALANVGAMRLIAGDEHGEADLARSLNLALGAGFLDHAGRALTLLAWGSLRDMRLDAAERHLARAIPYTTEHDLDNYRWFLLATQATVRFHRGEWREAETEARQILELPVQSPARRVMALLVVGQIAARSGDPAADALLDEALLLAHGSGQPLRQEPARVARAEAALLDENPVRARAELAAVRGLVFERGNRWQRGKVAWLLRQAGDQDIEIDNVAEPYALMLAGDWTAGAACWQRHGCLFEGACALAESDDPELLRQALACFEDLRARPQLARVIHRLRDLGVRELPTLRRGPRAATRAHPAGLTQREVEVLALVAAGLRNAEVADRLYLTPKTVSHHLSAIYAKLGVETRTEAVRVAAEFVDTEF